MLAALSCLLLQPSAHAEDGPDRYTPLGSSLAGVDGAAATLVNPAALGFDADPSVRLWYEQSLVAERQSVMLSTGLGGLGLAARYYRAGNGAPWWGLRSGLAINLLDENLHLGVAATWQLTGRTGDEGRSSFATWEIGWAARPLPMLGVAAVARNLGSPSPEDGVVATYGAGLVFRPNGELLDLGLDYLTPDPAWQTEGELGAVTGTVRFRPIEGLQLRAEVEQPVAFNEPARFGVGVEVWLDGLGAGAFVDDSASTAAGMLASEVDDDRLWGTDRRVPVFDLTSSYPYEASEGLLAVKTETWLHLLNRLDAASRDRSVTGVVLELGPTPFSLAQVQELRAAALKVSEAGKPVVAWLAQGADLGAYLLATGCDRVILHPGADLDLVGLALETTYYKGTMDLVGIDAQYARRSEYKSAVEPQLRTAPSDPAREQLEALLDDTFDAVVEDVAQGRKMTPQEVRAIVDGGPYTPEQALALGLVDRLSYRDELAGTLLGLFPRGADLVTEYRLLDDDPGWKPRRKIAVVYITGAIVPGDSSSGGLLSGPTTGSDTVSKQLEEAADDPWVEAVVLRVDSPGGSAWASDEIWRAVRRLQAEGLPVVVSMGAVAASGGYYVACAGDVIYAEPTTITGSIGVYAGKLSFSELFEKVGLSTTAYTRGRMAGMYSSSRPFDAMELEAMERGVEATYQRFKERVASGRNLSAEEVEEVARGRVWSGASALRVGLVDELGGLSEAVARARLEAGIGRGADVSLVSYGGSGGLFGQTLPESLETLLSTGRMVDRPLTWALPGVEVPPELKELGALLPLADAGPLALLPMRIDLIP